MYATLLVPGLLQQVATARRFVGAVLGAEHPEVDTAELLTSELVTNSLRHSASGRGAFGHRGAGCGGASCGASLLVTVSRTPEAVRVEVTDAGAATLPVRRAADDEDERGRGLALVEALATRWGTQRRSPGTVTWFEVAP